MVPLRTVITDTINGALQIKGEYMSSVAQNQSFDFSEKFLYHIWDAQHLSSGQQSKTLKSVSGKSVQIYFPGHYNTSNGPDFKNATLDINGQPQQGDVEIHIHSGDWYAHAHDSNPAFNNVILHMVYQHNHHMDLTIREDNQQVEILEIKDCLSEEIDKLFAEYSSEPFTDHPKYCPLFASIRPEFFEYFLEVAGGARLEKKIKRFRAELSFVSMDQLLYQSIFEALGYDKNKHPFYLFSKDNPWLGYRQRYLSGKKEYNDCRDTINGVRDRRDTINGVRNPGMSLTEFTESLIESAGFESKKYDWHLFRIRPCNQPKARIYQIAEFLYSSFATSLTTEILKLFSFVEGDFTLQKFQKRLYERFDVESPHTKYKLGKERINAMLINIFIPILMNYATSVGSTELYNLCLQIYSQWEGLKENHIDTLMRKYMTPQQYTLSQKKAIHQQGLLNTYHRYCCSHLCDVCCSDSKEMLT